MKPQAFLCIFRCCNQAVILHKKDLTKFIVLLETLFNGILYTQRQAEAGIDIGNP